MSLIPSSLVQNFESVSKIVGASSKFGVLIGGICIVLYCLRIKYLPQGLSLGDGLLFIMAAACFGVIYVFFVGSLVSLGIAVSPLVRAIFSIIAWGASLFKSRRFRAAHELARFEWVSLFFSIFSIYIIIVLGSKDPKVYWNLPLLSIGLYFFYSVYISYGNKIKKIEMIKRYRIHTEEKENIPQLGEVEKIRVGQACSLFVILLAPLFFGGVSGQLLDAAMRAAYIRIEEAVIYVKEPYSSLLPKARISNNKISPKDYIAFDGAVVLFRGLGTTTVISYAEGVNSKKIEIPNEYIIVESR
ncbi:hypothetical protein GSY71_13775 [Pusillimonas sp. TS35]|nr:hypothetical protein [Pusillimonas sp. TS35]